MSVQHHLKQAVQHHLAGETTLAEQGLRALLQAAPKTADAWHLLGVFALHRGAFASAVALLREAIGCQAGAADFHFNLGGGLFSLKRWAEAADAYRRATELDSEFAEAWKGLGASELKLRRWAKAMVALQKSLDCDARQPAVALQLAEACEELDRDPEAFAAARHALALEPYSAEGHRRMASLYGRKGDQLNQATAFYNVGESLRREQRTSEAIAALEEALRLHPAHGKAAHALACLTGRTPCTAPRDYVVDLFNGYADRFDAHLEQLEYRVPELLRAVLGRLLPPGRQAGRVLDLGCGSGRGGALFRDLATELSGVDLAPRMIDTARQRGVYDTLWVGDVREVSRTNPGPYQLLLATDVFIYVGALEEVFAEAARLCAPGGWFAFSVEEGASGYVLRESGRFAHAATYWKKLAENNDFAVVVDEAIPIRLHEGQPIPGRLGVLQRL